MPLFSRTVPKNLIKKEIHIIGPNRNVLLSSQRGTSHLSSFKGDLYLISAFTPTLLDACFEVQRIWIIF